MTGDRIAAIGKTGEVPIPPGARVVDATGKYLMPGLWDMHAHIFGHRDDAFFPLYAVAGITAVRDMNTVVPMSQIQERRKRLAEGTLIGPRLIAVAGPLIAGLAGGVGDPDFGVGVRVPVFRFRNDSDLVPHLPLGLLFRHVGQLQFIDGAGHLHRDLTLAMEMMLDPGAHLISAKESLTMQAQIRGGRGFELPVAGFLADHAPINYSILVWNCYDRS